jgi:hypothetical protein
MSGRRRKVVSREMHEVRRACRKPSYDEKKRKKSRSTLGDLFSALVTDRPRARRMKVANLAANRKRDDSALPDADSRISNRHHVI